MTEDIKKRKPKFNTAPLTFYRPSTSSSKYRTEYADLVFEHISSGFSFDTFSLNDVTHATILNWFNTNVEFRHAVIEGEKRRRMIIEAQGLKLLSKGNVAVWKTMLSEYQATDRVVVEQDIKQVFDAGDSETPKRLERLHKMRELMAEIDDASKVVEVEDLEFLDE